MRTKERSHDVVEFQSRTFIVQSVTTVNTNVGSISVITYRSSNLQVIQATSDVIGEASACDRTRIETSVKCDVLRPREIAVHDLVIARRVALYRVDRRAVIFACNFYIRASVSW